MRDLLPELARWEEQGTPVALATVISAAGSAPRRTGTALAVGGDGAIRGSLNAGCVEATVVDRCDAVIRSGQPERLHFDADDGSAWGVAPLCGDLEIFIRRVDPGSFSGEQRAALAVVDRSVALVTVLAAPAHPDTVGWHLVLGSDGPIGDRGRSPLLGLLAERLREQVAADDHGVQEVVLHPGRQGSSVEVFVELLPAEPLLLLVGADAVAAPLATLGQLMGYHVVVCDPRARFATPARFPDADEVVVAWPHRYLDDVGVAPDTTVCILTHDRRVDVPALERALRGGARYVGAMGSRRTQEDRVGRLRAAGVDDRLLARLRSPIGLDLQGTTPEEVAIAIAAELVSGAHGGSGLALSMLRGPLHRHRTMDAAS